MPQADCHLAKTAMTGMDDECGDTGVIVLEGDVCFIALVDVLGHGREAAQVAEVAKAYLDAHWDQELTTLMQNLHEHLKGSRGAVAFLARLDLPSGELRHVGIGNISAKVFGDDEPQRLLSKDGVVGYMMPSPRQQVHRLLPRDILMLASDGIRDHFELFEHPGLLRGSAEDVAFKVLGRLSKGDDDASCLILRYLK